MKLTIFCCLVIATSIVPRFLTIMDSRFDQGPIAVERFEVFNSQAIAPPEIGAIFRPDSMARKARRLVQSIFRSVYSMGTGSALKPRFRQLIPKLLIDGRPHVNFHAGTGSIDMIAQKRRV